MNLGIIALSISACLAQTYFQMKSDYGTAEANNIGGANYFLYGFHSGSECETTLEALDSHPEFIIAGGGTASQAITSGDASNTGCNAKKTAYAFRFENPSIFRWEKLFFQSYYSEGHNAELGTYSSVRAVALSRPPVPTDSPGTTLDHFVLVYIWTDVEEITGVYDYAQRISPVLAVLEASTGDLVRSFPITHEERRQPLLPMDVLFQLTKVDGTVDASKSTLSNYRIYWLPHRLFSELLIIRTIYFEGAIAKQKSIKGVEEVKFGVRCLAYFDNFIYAGIVIPLAGSNPEVLKPLITKRTLDLKTEIWSYQVKKNGESMSIEHFATHSKKGVNKIFAIGDRRDPSTYKILSSEVAFEIFVIHTGEIPTGCTRQIDSIRIKFDSSHFRDVAHLSYEATTDSLRVFYFPSYVQSSSDYDTRGHQRASSVDSLYELRIIKHFGAYQCEGASGIYDFEFTSSEKKNKKFNMLKRFSGTSSPGFNQFATSGVSEGQILGAFSPKEIKVGSDIKEPNGGTRIGMIFQVDGASYEETSRANYHLEMGVETKLITKSMLHSFLTKCDDIGAFSITYTRSTAQIIWITPTNVDQTVDLYKRIYARTPKDSGEGCLPIPYKRPQIQVSLLTDTSSVSYKIFSSDYARSEVDGELILKTAEIYNVIKNEPSVLLELPIKIEDLAEVNSQTSTDIRLALVNPTFMSNIYMKVYRYKQTSVQDPWLSYRWAHWLLNHPDSILGSSPLETDYCWVETSTAKFCVVKPDISCSDSTQYSPEIEFDSLGICKVYETSGKVYFPHKCLIDSLELRIRAPCKDMTDVERQGKVEFSVEDPSVKNGCSNILDLARTVTGYETLYIVKTSEDLALKNLIRTDFERTASSSSDWGFFTTCTSDASQVRLWVRNSDEAYKFFERTHPNEVKVLMSKVDIPSLLQIRLVSNFHKSGTSELVTSAYTRDLQIELVQPATSFGFASEEEEIYTLFFKDSIELEVPSQASALSEQSSLSQLLDLFKLEGGVPKAVTYLAKQTPEMNAALPLNIEMGIDRKTLKLLPDSLSDSAPPFYLGAQYADGDFVWKKIQTKTLPCNSANDFKLSFVKPSADLGIFTFDPEAHTVKLVLRSSVTELDPASFFSWQGDCLPTDAEMLSSDGTPVTSSGSLLKASSPSGRIGTLSSLMINHSNLPSPPTFSFSLKYKNFKYSQSILFEGYLCSEVALKMKHTRVNLDLAIGEVHPKRVNSESKYVLPLGDVFSMVFPLESDAACTLISYTMWEDQGCSTPSQVTEVVVQDYDWIKQGQVGNPEQIQDLVISTNLAFQAVVYLKIEVMSGRVEVLPFAITVKQPGTAVKPNSPPSLLNPEASWEVKIEQGTASEVVLECPPAIDIDSDPIQFAIDLRAVYSVLGKSSAEVLIQAQVEAERLFSIVLHPGNFNPSLTQQGHDFQIPVTLTDGKATTEYVFKLSLSIVDKSSDEVKDPEEEQASNGQRSTLDDSADAIELPPQEAEKLAQISAIFGEKIMNQAKGRISTPKKSPKGDPIITLSACEATGKVSLNFNHIMVTPLEEVDYGEMLQLSIVSALDGSEMIGWFKSPLRKRRLRQLEGASCLMDCDAKQKGFEWTILEHTPSNLDLKILFDDSRSISSTSFGEDRLSFKILEPALFLSQETFQQAIPMVASSCESSKLCSVVPPQMMSEEQAKLIVDTTQKVQTSMNILTTSNFFLSLLLGGAVQQLFGTIRLIQILLLSAVLKVVYPPHLNLFYSSCIIFAEMDILQGPQWYSQWFNFRYTEALNLTFAKFEIGDLNFFMNSGSLPLIFGFIVINWVFWRTIRSLAIKTFRYSAMRRLALYGDSIGQIKIPTKKLFLESYLDLALSAFLGCLPLLRSPSTKALLTWFSTPSDFLCSSTTLITLAFCLGGPYWIYHQIKAASKTGLLQHQHLHQHTQSQSPDHPSISLYYEEFKTSKLVSSSFLVVTLTRRLAMVFFLIHLTDYPSLLIKVLILLSLTQVALLLAIQPYKDKHFQKFEVYNELTVLTSCYFHHLFLVEIEDFTANFQSKALLGWLTIFNVSQNIAVNLILLGVDSAVTVWKELVSLRRAVQRRLQKGRLLRAEAYFQTEFDSNCLPDLRERRREEEALRFCQEYSRERAWMVKNKLPFFDLPEELKFQRLLSEFKFRQKRKLAQNEALIEEYFSKSSRRVRSSQGIIEVPPSATKKLLKKKPARFLSNQLPEISPAVDRPQRRKTLPSRLAKLNAIPEEEESLSQASMQTARYFRPEASFNSRPTRNRQQLFSILKEESRLKQKQEESSVIATAQQTKELLQETMVTPGRDSAFLMMVKRDFQYMTDSPSEFITSLDALVEHTFQVQDEKMATGRKKESILDEIVSGKPLRGQVQLHFPGEASLNYDFAGQPAEDPPQLKLAHQPSQPQDADDALPQTPPTAVPSLTIQGSSLAQQNHPLQSKPKPKKKASKAGGLPTKQKKKTRSKKSKQALAKWGSLDEFLP